MVDASAIRAHMPVIGSDGEHVGTVDGVEGDRIKLTRNDSADGEHHYIPFAEIARVDDRVHLSAPAAAALAGGTTVGESSATNPLPPVKNRAVAGAAPPKNFYLQGQPTLWEVYGIPKGGNDFFIQITTDQVVWGGLSGATPAEAVSWGKVNPGVLPDTCVTYCDSTIAFPLFAEYAVGHANGRRPLKGLVHRRDELVAALKAEASKPRADEDH